MVWSLEMRGYRSGERKVRDLGKTVKIIRTPLAFGTP